MKKYFKLFILIMVMIGLVLASFSVSFAQNDWLGGNGRRGSVGYSQTFRFDSAGPY